VTERLNNHVVASDKWHVGACAACGAYPAKVRRVWQWMTLCETCLTEGSPAHSPVETPTP